MFKTARSRWSDENGFDLIELLIVILVIGIIAAIAVPTFLGQRAKTHDKQAISLINKADMAMLKCHHDGIYKGCKMPEGVRVSTNKSGKLGYKLTTTSKSNHVFVIMRSWWGASRSCSLPTGKTSHTACPSGWSTGAG